MGVIEKSSALSGVSIKALTKLKNYVNMIHSDDIYLDMHDGKSVFEIETFEGTILIKYENNEIKYKFIPSADFNKLVATTIETNTSGLVKSLDNSVVNAMSNIYENLI